MPSIARRANIRRDEPTPACHAGSTMMRAESHEAGRSVSSSHLLTSLLPRSGSPRPPASASFLAAFHTIPCRVRFKCNSAKSAFRRIWLRRASLALPEDKSLPRRLTVAVLCCGFRPLLFCTIVAVALRRSAATAPRGRPQAFFLKRAPPLGGDVSADRHARGLKTTGRRRERKARKAQP